MLNQVPSIYKGNDTLAKNVGRIFTLGILLMVLGASVFAQQTVYKWVDKEGVVHFSDAPPDESESVETETLTTVKPSSSAQKLYRNHIIANNAMLHTLSIRIT